MSKENLSKVIDSVVNGDFETARSEFAAHTQEKSKQILNPPTDDTSNKEE